MNITRLKEFFNSPSSDLLSAADKQLALSNAIGIGVRFSFDACLRSNRSTDFKTAAAYAGLVAKGVNYFWKQSLIEQIFLAEKYPKLKKAVSPLAGVTLNGGAWILSHLKETYTSMAGWGLCQIQPLASAAVVGHDSGKKISKAWNCLSSRPREAVSAIGVHSFNFGCELWRVFSEWTHRDAEAWAERQESFSGKEREALCFFHGLSDPGRKIAVDRAASGVALDSYKKRLEMVEKQFDQALKAAKEGQALVDAAREADLEAILVGKIPTSPDLSWQDYFAGQAAFETSVLQMKEKWKKSWESWEKRVEQKSRSELDRMSRVEPGLKSDLLQKDLERAIKLTNFCNQIDPMLSGALVKLDQLDLNHFPSQEVIKGIGQLVQRKENSCKKALKQKIGAIQTQVSHRLKDMPERIGKAIGSAPFEKMYGLLKGGEVSIGKGCGNWTESLRPLKQKGDSLKPWVVETIGKAIEEIHRTCDEKVKEWRRIWDLAYLKRANEKVGLSSWVKFWWDVGFSGWWTGGVPSETPYQKETHLARQILNIDLKDQDAAKQVLSLREPWPWAGESPERCRLRASRLQSSLQLDTSEVLHAKKVVGEAMRILKC